MSNDTTVRGVNRHHSLQIYGTNRASKPVDSLTNVGFVGRVLGSPRHRIQGSRAGPVEASAGCEAAAWAHEETPRQSQAMHDDPRIAPGSDLSDLILGSIEQDGVDLCARARFEDAYADAQAHESRLEAIEARGPAARFSLSWIPAKFLHTRGGLQ